mgnify:CR=1 FL=1
MSSNNVMWVVIFSIGFLFFVWQWYKFAKEIGFYWGPWRFPQDF